MKMLKSFLIILTGLIITSCGDSDKSNDGASAMSGAQRFESDMTVLNRLKIKGEAVDQSNNGIFSKAFGGSTEADVRKFIRARVRHVYHLADLGNLKTEVYQNGSYVGTDTLNELFGWGDPIEPKKNEDFATLAYNYSSDFFYYMPKYSFNILFPTGAETVYGSRIGLVALTPAYMRHPKAKQDYPQTYRLSILAHEGRHSDCPVGSITVNGTENSVSQRCGFGHKKCSPGHDLEGEYACDQYTWGPYGIQVLVLMGIAANYPDWSDEALYYQAVIDDIQNRIDEAVWQQMQTGETPDMSSM